MYLLAGLLAVACSTPTPKVANISIDLPVSFKSDTAAYRFITEYTKAWNDFGKKIDALYREGEKWREKDFDKLSNKELNQMLKLDYEYAALWVAQSIFIDKMLLEMEHVVVNNSEQGAAKVAEAHYIFANYYRDLLTAYGDDLKLDKEEYIFSPEEDSLYRARRDTMRHPLLDSLAKRI